MSSTGRGSKGGKNFSPMEKRKTRSTTASASATSTAFPSFGPAPHHSLDQSRKRGRNSGIGPAQGDDRVTGDELKTFTPRPLSPTATSSFNALFKEADEHRDKRRKTSFAKVETHKRDDGATEHQAFGVIEPIGGVLTGRTVATPKSNDGRPGVDDASHAIPLSGVSDQTAVNKRSFVFSESSTANRGGARVVERHALARADSADFGDIAQVTRWTTPPDSERPTHVTRAVLKRDKRSKKVNLLFATSHDNKES